MKPTTSIAAAALALMAALSGCVAEVDSGDAADEPVSAAAVCRPMFEPCSGVNAKRWLCPADVEPDGCVAQPDGLHVEWCCAA